MKAQLAAEQRFIDALGGRTWLDRYVLPYYLQWMGLGPKDGLDTPTLTAEVRARALELGGADIATMLQMMQWRVQVMGAWYAIARSDSSLTTAVHSAFDECRGTLTAPVLTAAALSYPNEGTVQVLQSYLQRHTANNYGDSSIITAAIRRLQDPNRDAPRAAGDEALDRLLGIARRLQGAEWPTLPPPPLGIGHSARTAPQSSTPP